MKKIQLTVLFFVIIVSTAFSQKVITANQVGDFSNDLAPFLSDNNWGFFDKEGNIVIQPKFKAFVSNYGALLEFSEDLTSIVDIETEKVGYINKNGEIVIEPTFYSANKFSEGVAFVGRQNDYVLIDKTGNIIAKNFVAINGYFSNFSNNRACVQKEFAYGYIDKSGKFVINAEFEEARDFANGLAAVKKDSNWGFIDTTGAVIIDFKFNNEPLPFNDNRSFILGSNNKWGIIDNKGSIIVEPTYNKVFGFNGGVAVVSILDEKWNTSYQIIDLNGKPVKTFSKEKNSSETISILSGFSEGLAVAMKGYKKGFIDSKGKSIVGFKYRELKPLSCGMAYFEKFDEKTKKETRGFLDKTGKEVIFIEGPKF